MLLGADLPISWCKLSVRSRVDERWSLTAIELSTRLRLDAVRLELRLEVKIE